MIHSSKCSNCSVTGRVDSLRHSGPLRQLCHLISILPTLQMITLWELTMDALSILLLLPVENGVFVFRQHLLLNWHLLLPSLHSLRSNTLLSQSSIHNCDHVVNSAETFPLSCLLELRESPWDLPISRITVSKALTASIE